MTFWFNVPVLYRLSYLALCLPIGPYLLFVLRKEICRAVFLFKLGPHWMNRFSLLRRFFFELLSLAENCFEIQLSKGTQGLGFSIQGGRGIHKDPKMCLLRIKKVFAGQRASASGLVEEGDVILTVNEEPVYHLTHAVIICVLAFTNSVCRYLRKCGLNRCVKSAGYFEKNMHNF